MKIPFHDFGGNGPLLHFSHPNAYTPRCFEQVVKPLLPHYRVIGVYHRPLWPGARLEELTSWEMLGEDMLRFFDQQGIESVVGVGMSMGAVATLFAAVKRPSLFSKLVFIEPVVLPPAFMAQVQAQPELLDQVPIIAKARRRQDHWPTRQAAFDYFCGKKAFSRWTEPALWDYVNFGMGEVGDQIRLSYSREWEAHCYSLAAYPAWDVIPQVRQPLLVIRAADTDSLWLESWRLWQEIQPQTDFRQIEEASHMVVMERPFLTAKLILDFLL